MSKQDKIQKLLDFILSYESVSFPGNPHPLHEDFVMPNEDFTAADHYDHSAFVKDTSYTFSWEVEASDELLACLDLLDDSPGLPEVAATTVAEMGMIDE